LPGSVLLHVAISATAEDVGYFKKVLLRQAFPEPLEI
jgi:hypothetical protein